MIKVGVIGEDPYDTKAIINLLKKRHTSVGFKQMGKKLTGCSLDSEKFFKTISLDMDDTISVVICTRDLDGFDSQVEKLKARQAWFDRLNDVLGEKGIFLLNIFELEALILADIESFNLDYRVSINFRGDPAMISDPKGLLQSNTRKAKKTYAVSHCPSVFDKLNIDIIERNCRYFKVFLQDFRQRIARL